MRTAFMCSLIRNGILGFGLYLDQEAVTYRTQKLTVDKQYRNLVLPLDEIAEVTWKRIVFPVAAFHLKSRETYTFLIFNKTRFCKYFLKYSSNSDPQDL